MTNTGDYTSSMLQDFRANKRTEIKDINGFAARFLAARKRDNTINNQLKYDVLALTR